MPEQSIAFLELTVTRLYVAALKLVPGSEEEKTIRGEIARIEAEISLLHERES